MLLLLVAVVEKCTVASHHMSLIKANWTPGKKRNFFATYNRARAVWDRTSDEYLLDTKHPFYK